MKNLLFLVHRIPYPPNKGDKIRSYHFLKGLSKNYHVYLAAFIDDPADHIYVDKVKELTTDSLFVSLNSAIAKVKSLSGLLTQEPLTIPYYKNTEVQQWVDKVIVENKIEKVFVFSSAMAQFIEKHYDLDVIIDFVDVDSDKWLQYSKKLKWPMSWVYKRESKQLLKFDSKAAILAQKSLFVSEDEAKLFRKLVNQDSNKIDFVNNGVDVNYFQNTTHYPDPYDSSENVIVFTGAMDYWANVDAVTWFVKKVFPKIKQQCSHARFYIVGSNPTKDVLLLSNIQDVFVTGRVDDIRPYLRYANIVVAPLLIARGIQNKVLEAMAMGKTIVATSQAIEGINVTNQTVYIQDDEDDFAEQVLIVLADNKDKLNVEANRLFVESNFSWDASLKKLTQIID